MAENMPNGNTRSFVSLIKDTRVGRYRIIERLGMGGMGEVYLAEDTDLKRQIALKFLSPSLASDSDCRARFIREAQAVAKLNHPNISSFMRSVNFRAGPSLPWSMSRGNR